MQKNPLHLEVESAIYSITCHDFDLSKKKFYLYGVKVLFYILLAFAVPFALVLVYAVGYAFYLIATSKDKSPEIQAKIADLKQRKADKKAAKEAAKRAKPAIYLRNRRGGFLTSWMD